MADEAKYGLNIVCDPIGTVYAGGTPLFDERTGTSITREDYVGGKGLNGYCDPSGTHYPGGSPLFDELTGERLSRGISEKNKIQASVV